MGNGPDCVISNHKGLIRSNIAKPQALHQLVKCFIQAIAWEIPVNTQYSGLQA